VLVEQKASAKKIGIGIRFKASGGPSPVVAQPTAKAKTTRPPIKLRGRSSISCLLADYYRIDYEETIYSANMS
jgi:hypothetical protein